MSFERILSAIIAPGLFVGTPVDLVIVAGGGNAAGVGTTVAGRPSNLQSALTNTKTRHPNLDTWQTYQAGVNSMLQQDGGPYPSVNLTYWGPEAEYLRRYTVAFGGKTVYAIKLAFPSSSLSQDARIPGNGCWDHTLSNDLYAYAVAEINAACASFQALGLAPNVRAVIWADGEADAMSSIAAASYQSNLSNLIDALRAATPIGSAPFVITRMPNAASLTNRATIRTAQVAVGETKADCYWVNTDDLTLAADGVSYSNAAMVTLGFRAYQTSRTGSEVYSAYAARLSTAPTAQQEAALRAFLQGLLDKSIFTTLAATQIYCHSTQANALTELITTNTNLFQPSQTGMTFVPGAGFVGTSTTSNVGTACATWNTPIITQDSAAYSFFTPSNNDIGTSAIDMGATNGGSGFISFKVNPAATNGWRVHNPSVVADNTYTAPADVSGLWTVMRTGPQASSLWHRGVLVDTDTTSVSAAPATSDIQVGNRSGASVGTVGRTYSMFIAGAARSAGQEAALYSLCTALTGSMAP